MKNTNLTNDQLTKMHTAAQSFTELLDLGKERGYRPTLLGKKGTEKDLADRYDAAQAARGDERRAYRGSSPR